MDKKWLSIFNCFSILFTIFLIVFLFKFEILNFIDLNIVCSVVCFWIILLFSVLYFNVLDYRIYYSDYYVIAEDNKDYSYAKLYPKKDYSYAVLRKKRYSYNIVSSEKYCSYDNLKNVHRILKLKVFNENEKYQILRKCV